MADARRFALTALLASGAALGADAVSQALAATQQADRAQRASQQRVSQLDDATQAALEKYRNTLWRTQQMNAYAEQLDQIAATQQAERNALQQQLAGMDDTERDILPLMLRMATSLEQFVVLDLPFLQAERRERIANLKRALADPDLKLAEKYHRLLEAYQVEIDYGRTLGAERTELPLSGTAKIVDVLHVGRVGLFYLSLDGEDVGGWDAAGKQWKPLSGEYRGAVKKGLKIAREVSAADLLVLPLPAPVDAAAPAAGAAK